jgi:hypothetical protein
MSERKFLVTLAPYFFPLYTVLVTACYGALGIFFEVRKYAMFWLWLVGLTWGFHLTFTVNTLMQRQSDIREYGAVFSCALIVLLNAAGVGLWIVGVSPATLEQMEALLREHVSAAYGGCLGWITLAAAWFASLLGRVFRPG